LFFGIADGIVSIFSGSTSKVLITGAGIGFNYWCSFNYWCRNYFE
jgi:hypothetical protein